MVLFQNKEKKIKMIFKAVMTGIVCLLVGLSLLGFPKNIGKAVKGSAEESVSIATSDLFTTSTTNTKFQTTLNEATGVLAWNRATLNGVFKNEAKIEYTMEQWRNVVFGICDTNGNELITFTKVYYNQWRTAPYAYYNGTFSVPNTINQPTTTTTAFEKNTDVTFGSTTYIFPEPGGGESEKVGYVHFALENGTFKIAADGKYCRNYANNDWPVVEMQIANFELTAEDAAKLSNGFQVKIRALDSSKASDVSIDAAYASLSCVITKINDIAVDGETVMATLSPNGSITYSGEYIFQGKNVIELMEGEEIGSFIFSPNYLLGSFAIASSTNESFSYGGGTFADKEAGEYSITVTKGTNSKLYTVIIHETEETATETLFTSSSTIALEKEIKGYKGVQIKGESMLEGIFKESIEIEYVMSNEGALNCVFALCDIEGNEIVTFTRVWENNWHSIPYAYYNGNFSTPNKDLTKVETTPVISETAFKEHKLNGQKDIPFGSTTYTFPEPGSGAAEENVGYVKFAIENGKLKITAPGKYYLGGYINGVLAVADFDLTTADAEKLGNGFKLKIRALDASKDSDVVATNNGVTCLLTKVNGVKLGNKIALLPPAEFNVEKISTDGFLVGDTIYVAKNSNAPSLFVEGYYYGLGVSEYKLEKLPLPYEGNYNVAQTGTYSVTAYNEVCKQPYAYTMIVENSYKITFDVAGGDAIAERYYSENTWDFQMPTPNRKNWKFEGWFNGDKKITALTAYMKSDLTLTAKWYDDVPPVVYFDNVEPLLHIDDPKLFIVAKTDIKIVDGADTDLNADDITISIKAPNSSEYIDQESFTFDPLKYGFYEIKYDVVDHFGNQTTVERQIYYTPTTPTLTINGTLKEEYFVGEKVVLPTATGLSGEESLPVTASVLYNDQAVELVDNAFTPQASGEYQVLYFVKDAYEQIASKNLTITVIDDTIAPEISVEFNTEQVEVGTMLNIPNATATDNVDGELGVTVEVYLGTERIADKSFTPQEVGVYTVYYICEDSAGNQSTIIKYVTVYEKDKKEKKNGCSSVVAGSMSIGILLAGSVLFLIKRKDKNE